MKKLSFTLLEMMIAISIFAILVVFLINTTNSLSYSNKLYQHSLNKKLLQTQIQNLIFNDILLSSDILKIDYSDKNVILELISTNTLYNPFNNYITYQVTKENKLIRYETAYKRPKVINSDYIQSLRVDVLYQNIEKFYVQLSKDKKFILIYIKQKSKEPISFEIALL